MNIIYQSSDYTPELVTGRYVRCLGKRGSYVFRVYETATGVGTFAGRPGFGGTLLEYDCDGADIPEDIKAKAIKSKQMEHYPL